MHDATFSRNLFSNVDVTGIKLPWEVGIYRELFSDEPFAVPLVPKMPINDFCSFDVGTDPQHVTEQIASVASHVTAHPVFEKCVSAGDEPHYQEKRQQLRDVAIGKLLIVLNHNLEVSVTGRHVLQLVQGANRDNEAADIVSSVVGVKSPATLVKRANSLLAFIRWCNWIGRSDTNFFQESIVWDYFQFLKTSCAPASKADSMMSALRFAFYVLGFECLGGTVTSRRLVGACELMLTGKRLLRQALVLTVFQIKILHGILMDTGRHLMDRVLVVHILFSFYGRCRHSDLLAIHTIDCDIDAKGGFVTITTCAHKSGRMASLKTRLLPIVIPARGVDGSVWPLHALEVLREAGCLPVNPVDGPLVHAPGGSPGTFLTRGLRSTEVSKALRCFLGLPEPVPGCNEELVSSHSLKATLLAWAARFGLTPQTRSLLGRHTSCLNETFAIYSRDLSVAPVVELQKLIDAVAAGTFEPDNERSKFFRSGSIPVGQTCAKEECDELDDFIVVQDSPDFSERCEPVGGADVQAPCYGEDQPFDVPVGISGEDSQTFGAVDAGTVSDSDSSTSGSDASSSDGSDLGAAQHRVKRFRARIPVHEEWFVHGKSHLVHRYDGDQHNDVRFLVCGKRLTNAYHTCTEATAWNTLCKSCNRR